MGDAKKIDVEAKFNKVMTDLDVAMELLKAGKIKLAADFLDGAIKEVKR